MKSLRQTASKVAGRVIIVGLCSSCAAVYGQQSAQDKDDQSQTPASLTVTGQNDVFSVKDVTSGDSELPGKWTWKIVLHDRERNRDVDRFISGYYNIVEGIRFCQNNLMIARGGLRRGGTYLCLVDLVSGATVEEIRTYGYTFSPSGRYIVYETHYPPHGLPETRRCILLLYDTQKSPSENRVPGTTTFSKENAGIPIFPRANVEAKSYDIMLEEEHLCLSEFLWSPDEKRIVFIDYLDSNHTNYIVAITLTKDGEVRIASQPIETDPLIKWDLVTTEQKRRELGERPIKLTARKLEWQDEDSVVLTQFFHEYFLPDTLVLKVPGGK